MKNKWIYPALFSIMGCTLKYQEGVPDLYNLTAPEYVITYPTFPVTDYSSLSIQYLIENILKDVREYTDDDVLSSSSMCKTDIPYHKLKDRFSQYEQFAEVTTAQLTPLYKQTLSRLKKNNPEAKRLLSLLNANRPDDTESYETGTLWLLTKIFAEQMCATKSVSKRAGIVFALTHFVSSEQAVYDTLFTGLVEEKITNGNDLYWFRITSLETAILKIIGDLTPTFSSKVASKDFYKTTNAKVVVNSNGFPIQCNSEVKISRVKSPNLTSAGPVITKDSQFYLQIACTNTSNTKM